jgi:hypothetical protein
MTCQGPLENMLGTTLLGTQKLGSIPSTTLLLHVRTLFRSDKVTSRRSIV